MHSTTERDRGRFGATSKSAKLLIEFDVKPMTDFEAACKVIPLDGFHSRFEGCRRRCSDLRVGGYLRDSGKRRPNAGSTDDAIVWEITQEGRAAIRRLLETGWSR